MGIPRLQAAIDANIPNEELLEKLQEVESLLPICGSAPDTPYYLLTPPTFEPGTRWTEMLSAFPLQPNTLGRLLQNGFMPFDIALFEKRVGERSFFKYLTKKTVVPIDLDYGIAPYAEQIPHWANVAFTREVVERYSRLYPEIRQSRDLFLSLGALRNQRLMAKPPSVAPYAPLVFSTETRLELDVFLAVLRKRADLNKNYQLWFRGQADDYLLGDLREEAHKGICPWRTQQDSSLVPSLYRNLASQLNDYRSYVSFCLEYARYSLFIKRDLNIKDYTVRKPHDPLLEFLNEEWYKHYPQFTSVIGTDTKDRESFSILMRRGGVDPVGTTAGATEIHDYHPIYRSLQQIFFMQHYGLPSNILDITHDIDVALFFAQNNIAGQTIVPVDFQKHKPIIYIFLLKPGLDLFLDSQKLSEEHGLLRPLRQKCGLLFGASLINRNDYARFVALKINLMKPIEYEAKPEYLFPSQSEDPFLKRLLEFQQDNQLQFMKPWAYKRPE